MSFSLIPDGVCPSIYDLDYEALARRGVRLVLADLDNTLIPYSEGMPDQALTDWLTRLRGLGMELFVVSNSRKSKRVPQFCQALGVPYIRHAGKPKPGGYYKALEQMGCRCLPIAWGPALPGCRCVWCGPLSLETPSAFCATPWSCPSGRQGRGGLPPTSPCGARWRREGQVRPGGQFG